MATVHQAQVLRVSRFVSGSALVRLRMEAPSSLPYAAGQYLIVNTGLTLPTGKAAKRAYSIFGGDEARQEFYLAAERLEHGVVSNFLNELAVGDQLLFSGPWGKFLAPVEGWHAEKPLVAIAVATGITALLGLLDQASLAPGSQLIWVRDPKARFLPDSIVLDFAPRSLHQINIIDLPPDEPIAGAARLALEAMEAQDASYIYLAGEGQALDQLETLLIEHEIRPEQIRKESFFRRASPH